MIAGTFRPRWKKESRGPRPMCCQHMYIIYIYIYQLELYRVIYCIISISISSSYFVCQSEPLCDLTATIHPG